MNKNIRQTVLTSVTIKLSVEYDFKVKMDGENFSVLCERGSAYSLLIKALSYINDELSDRGIQVFFKLVDTDYWDNINNEWFDLKLVMEL